MYFIHTSVLYLKIYRILGLLGQKIVMDGHMEIKTWYRGQMQALFTIIIKCRKS